METINFNVIELSTNDMLQATGGTFAYDVGWALNFLWDVSQGDLAGLYLDIAIYEYHYEK